MPKEAIRYIEQKTDGNANLHDKGPAVIAKVRFSNSGLTIYYGDRTFIRNPSKGGPGNYYCLPGWGPVLDFGREETRKQPPLGRRR